MVEYCVDTIVAGMLLSLIVVEVCSTYVLVRILMISNAELVFVGPVLYK